MIIDFNKLQINTLKPKTDFEKKAVFFIEEFLSASESVEVQSSGSTGTPKLFKVKKSKMLNSAAMTCGFLDLKKGDLALLCLPVEYISGKMMVVRAVFAELKLIVKDPVLQPLRDLEEKVDFCAMTPLQVENSLDKIHLIKKLIIGGAAVSENLKEKIASVLNQKNTNTEIFETYGMSETLSHIALKRIFPVQEDFFSVLKNIEIVQNEEGCLKISAPDLAEGWLQTNDIVEIKNGNQFKFLARADNVINSGGAKIFPEQLEALVKKNIDREVVFLGINDESLGQRLILVVEGSENELLKSQISDLRFEKSFHKPKEVIFLDQIPRTPNGKIDRMELKRLFSV
ncbi:AMP-dependent synthetase [Chryseobacterium sp. Leaf180]|uniref:AMP-binding protein n=1 Tax=Chryseobacterium sp. Leaf180 TaxID=1736289 RepID=UPI0006FC2E37|nr:AMP-binding protein [Chryseobacterium sp. Leaf180]KQR91969.1 AMP-dependent synthetase [Chryseobacterium sp. Leaf180]